MALLQSENIKHWKSLPYNPSSNGSVERSNAVLARAIGTRERQFDKKNWDQALSGNKKGLINGYNKTWQSSIRTTPLDAIQAFKDQDAAELATISTLLHRSKKGKKNNTDKPLFQIGDKVQLRIALEKSGGLSWTRDWYKITEVNVERQQAPGGAREDYIVSYRLEDSKGELQPYLTFNDSMLRYVKPSAARQGKMKQPELFVIQYLLRPVVPKQGPYKDKPCYVAKYHGYPKAEYALRNDLLADTPKLIKQFDDKFNVKWSQDAAGKWTVTSDRD